MQKRFTRDLILRRNFDPHILPNSKKFYISMQRALLDIHFIMLLEELIRQNYLELGETYGAKFSRKIKSLVKRS